MRSATRRSQLRHELGFGLVELLLAIAVASLVLLAVAGVVLAIGVQGRLARWDTDRGLAARRAVEATIALGFAGASGGTGSINLGRQTYGITRSVASLSSRLEEIVVLVTSPGRTSAAYATRLARTRPLPVAP